MYLGWSRRLLLSLGPEISRVYIENGGRDYVRVLCGSIGTSYLMQLCIYLWYDTTSMIPRVQNSTDAVYTPPPHVSSWTSCYRHIYCAKLHLWHIKYRPRPPFTQRKDLNKSKKANFDGVFLRGWWNTRIKITFRSFRQRTNNCRGT